MAPIAVARQAHHLPGVAVERHLCGAGETALGVAADRSRRHRCRQHLACEQLLRSDRRIVGVGERRQWLRIERALVLRPRGDGAGDEGGDQERDQTQAGCHLDHSVHARLARIRGRRTALPSHLLDRPQGGLSLPAAICCSCSGFRESHGGRMKCRLTQVRFE
ncbi:hypothetical protein chiPu_0031673 [Chiloscyllium punctatum]|uniref:Uncharacterized protein n=1 Tax=Chiloscyllium punctatum TaxID=137246 RepID=A0A401TXX2_CHIPU|nr:hypothetical protein [Chiloscyllium punctatum]